CTAPPASLSLSLHDALPISALLASAALFTSLPASAQTPSDETGEAWSDETTYDAPSEPSTDAALSEEPVNEPPPEETTDAAPLRSEEHTSELQSRENLVCRL